MHALLVLLLALSAAPRRVTDDNGCNKGIDANNELDGEIVCTADGQKRFEGMYAHGKMVGVAKTWRDGKLASVVHYVDGKKSGLSEEYTRESFLDEACNYKDDKKDGLCKLYGREGKLREERQYVAGEQRGPFTGYWPNGKVQEKGRLDENGRRDGLYERFREDGTPDEAVPYAHGARDGLAKEWHPNGQLHREVTWKADRQNGLSRTFHENGQLADTNCTQNGTSVLGTNPCTGKSGPEVVTRSFPDGKPLETSTVRDGKLNGERQRFDKDGQLKTSETYANDLLDGPQKNFEGGKPKRQQTWKAGKKTGPETTWFDDGKIAEETIWKDDQRQAHTTWWMNGKKRLSETLEGELWKRASWYDDGQQELGETVRQEGFRGGERNEGTERRWSVRGTLVRENTWKDGRRHGTQKSWFDGSGKPTLEEEWADDVRLSGREWDESGKLIKDERYNPDGSRK